MILETPLGCLEFSTSLEGTEQIFPFEVTYAVFAIEPDLPEGMEVQNLTAVLVKLMSQVDRANVRVGFRWLESPGIASGPQSGEWLDAQAWEGNGYIITVGTEDCDALASRLPELGLKEENCTITCRADGIEVLFPHIPGGMLVSLHFVVAVNTSPERVECSSWFAVDVLHRKLLAAVVEGQLCIQTGAGTGPCSNRATPPVRLDTALARTPTIVDPVENERGERLISPHGAW